MYTHIFHYSNSIHLDDLEVSFLAEKGILAVKSISHGNVEVIKIPTSNFILEIENEPDDIKRQLIGYLSAQMKKVEKTYSIRKKHNPDMPIETQASYIEKINKWKNWLNWVFSAEINQPTNNPINPPKQR